MTVDATSLGSLSLLTLRPTSVKGALVWSGKIVSALGTVPWIRKLTDQRAGPTYTFTLRRPDLLTLLEFWEAHLGATKRFWIPTWQMEFVVTADIDGLSIHVAPTGIKRLWRGVERIMILTKDTMYVRQVTSVDVVEDDEVMYLDSTIGQMTKDEVLLLCRVLLARFDTQVLTVQYRPVLGLADVTFKVLELAGEYSDL